MWSWFSLRISVKGQNETKPIETLEKGVKYVQN